MKPWDFEPGRLEPRLDWKPTRMLPPEVQLTEDDIERITIARRMNSITRAYILGLLAGIRRNQVTVDLERSKVVALQRALNVT